MAPVVDCGSRYLPNHSAGSAHNSTTSSLVWVSLRNLGGDICLVHSNNGSALHRMGCCTGGNGLSLVAGGDQRHSDSDDKKVFQAT